MVSRIRAGEVDSMIEISAANRKAGKGSAAVEFALLVTLMLLLLLGAADFGRALYARLVLQGVANAGAHYGTRLTGAYTDTAGIQAAALADAGGLSGVLVNSSVTCFCSLGGACNGVCGGPTETDPTPYYLLTVSASYTFTPAVPNFPGMPSSIPMSASVSMRAQ